VSYESVSPRSPATGLSAEEIAAKSFPAVRRGLDPDAVHRYLLEVATVLKDARRREELLRARVDGLERAEPRTVDRPVEEDGLTEALGEETAKVLQAAREAARDLIARGERRASALIADAESALAERSRHAEEEADALMARARAEAAGILESTREQSRSMVDEAREARRRILTDLAERRRTLHSQLEQLRAGKETLASVIDGVSESILLAVDSVRSRLDGADAEARAAAAAAVHFAAAGDEDLAIDEAPPVDEPSVSAELAASLTGERARSSESRESASPVEERAEESPRPERTQGIDELFARIRESRQLEVAETRAQIEAVERELSAPSPDPEDLPGRDGPAPAAIVNGEANGGVAVDTRSSAAGATGASTLVETKSNPLEATLARDAELEATPLATAPSSTSAASEIATALADVDGAAAEPSGEEQRVEATPFSRRDGVLRPGVGELGRSLKRTLRVEQNELLDAARHLKNPKNPLDLLPAEQMAGRVAASVIPSLEAAWHAGVSFVDAELDATESVGAPLDVDAKTEITEISRQLAIEIVDPIRRRMEVTLASASDEPTSLSEAVNAGFRDWRASRLDEVAEEYGHRVFSRAIVSASRSRKVKLAWLVDDKGASCPDCDDNALAGPIIAGSLFPTGHSHPPIHPACHCVLLPVRE
jgi:DivIVA domain-containing protein